MATKTAPKSGTKQLDEALDEGEGGAAKGGRKKVLVAVVALLAVAAGAWFFLLRGSGAEAAEAEPEPEAGEVLALDPVSINLADGHYLRVGLALQLTADAAHEPEGSQALDLAISTFTGKSVEELSEGAKRDEVKAHLEEQIEEAYHHEVMGIYFTEFVTQ